MTRPARRWRSLTPCRDWRVSSPRFVTRSLRRWCPLQVRRSPCLCHAGGAFRLDHRWDLVLEYTVASSTVAHGWSHYFQDFLSVFHKHIPTVLSNSPFDFNAAQGKWWPQDRRWTCRLFVIAGVGHDHTGQGDPGERHVQLGDSGSKGTCGAFRHRGRGVLCEAGELASVCPLRIHRHEPLREDDFGPDWKGRRASRACSPAQR